MRRMGVTTMETEVKAARPLTDRQRRVLKAIHDHAADFGCYPTHRELMEALGYRSPNGVVANLDALERKGYLRYAGRPKEGGMGQARLVRLVGMCLVPAFEGEAGDRLRRELEAQP